MAKPFIPGRPRWWQWLTVLSLDAPLVAVVWQALFTRILAVDLDWYQHVLLGLTVWIVYAADRWIEGWLIPAESVRTQRHFFYIRRRWPVFGVGLAAIAFCAWLALSRLGRREWAAGFILVAPILFYLLSHQLVHRHHPRRVPKEICIACIFSLGTALAPAVLALPAVLSASHFSSDIVHARLDALAGPLLLFGMLCFSNLGLISEWETEVDRQHGQTSLALQFSRGRRFIHALPWMLVALGCIAALGAHAMDRASGLCVAGSGFLLGLLDRLEPNIGRESARALVDLALLTPVVALLLA